MITNKYALAVEIDHLLFEVFDIFYLEKNSEVDLRYKKGTNIPARAICVKDKSKIKIGSFWDGKNISSNEPDGFFEIDDNQDAYVFLSDNYVFGVALKLKEDPDNDKYQAAFDGNVILIDVSSDPRVGFGDLWDGQKLKPII